MDPIAAATAVPLETTRPVEPARDPAAANDVAGPAQAQNGLSDEQIAAYTDTAAAFVGQMYLTLWREAQRNSG